MQLFIRYLSRSCLFLWALSTFALAQIDELSATVDKNPVLADESITLSVVASGDASREAFDPSPLNADFIVGRTSVSSQTQMINFDTTRTTIWTTVLIPRKPGRFVIPAFTIEGQSSAPINMMVLPVSARQSTEGRDVYVTTSVDTDETYLQQQIRYTVKLFLARDLQRGSLSAPTLVEGEIRQIGKDAEYNDIVDGKRYRVIERTFAVIPQKSGTFTIQGPMFEGEVVQDRQQSFGFFSRSKTINRVGPTQEITVKPIPANYSGTWLPSDYVELHEEWQPNATEFKAGEPITRTLTLTAVGVDEAQLPNINSQYPSGVKVYPNQPNTTTVEKDNTLIAQRTETIAIIPSQAGEFTLEEVSVPWFNIVSGQVEYATLPKRTITVVAGANNASAANTAPTVANNAPLPPTLPSAEQAAKQGSQHSVEQSISGLNQKTNLWFWISCALTLLWITTLIGWALHIRRLKVKASLSSGASNGVAHNGTTNKAHPSEKQAWNSLQASMGKKDSQAIIQALTVWLNALTGSHGKSLSTLQNEFHNASLDQAVNTLYASKFSAEDKQWNREELVSTFSLIRQQASAHQSNKKLASLY